MLASRRGGGAVAPLLSVAESGQHRPRHSTQYRQRLSQEFCRIQSVSIQRSPKHPPTPRAMSTRKIFLTSTMNHL